jgi:hypothetical protein
MSTSCTAEPKTFSYSCGGVCEDEYSPCVAFNASDSSCADCVEDADGVCKYHCFSFLDGTPYWAFLLEFGAYESAQEVAARMTDSSFDEKVAGLKNESVDYWHYSNDLLTRFSALDIPSYVDTMCVASASPLVRALLMRLCFGSWVPESSQGDRPPTHQATFAAKSQT